MGGDTGRWPGEGKPSGSHGSGRWRGARGNILWQVLLYDGRQAIPVWKQIARRQRSLCTMATPWRQARSSKYTRASATLAREGSSGRAHFATATMAGPEVSRCLASGRVVPVGPRGPKVRKSMSRHRVNDALYFGRFVDRLRHVSLEGGPPESPPPSRPTIGGYQGPPTPRRPEW